MRAETANALLDHGPDLFLAGSRDGRVNDAREVSALRQTHASLDQVEEFVACAFRFEVVELKKLVADIRVLN